MTRIGFVGLGTMGMPMARNLIKGGFDLGVYDIDEAAAEALSKDGARPAASPREVAEGADFVVTMLPAGKQVREVLFAPDGITETLSKDALFIDMSTILPQDTDEIGGRLRAAGFAMIDAPVGRQQQQAVEGTLLIMAGGEAADVERARPLLERMGDTIVHCGSLGMGGRMKMVNNYMSIALNVLTGEALTLAEACGLDVRLALEVMGGTAAGRGHMSTTYPSKVLKGDLTPGFMVDLAHKDMGLALDMAAACHAPMTLGAASRQFYAVAQAQGRGRDDWSCLYPMIRRLAGLT